MCKSCISHLGLFSSKKTFGGLETFFVVVRFDLRQRGCKNPFFMVTTPSSACCIHVMLLFVSSKTFPVSQQSFFFFFKHVHESIFLSQAVVQIVYFKSISGFVYPCGTNRKYIFSSLCWHKRNMPPLPTPS